MLILITPKTCLSISQTPLHPIAMLMILNKMGMRDLTPSSTVQWPGVTFRPPDFPFLNREHAVLSVHLSRLLGTHDSRAWGSAEIRENFRSLGLGWWPLSPYSRYKVWLDACMPCSGSFTAPIAVHALHSEGIRAESSSAYGLVHGLWLLPYLKVSVIYKVIQIFLLSFKSFKVLHIRI